MNHLPAACQYLEWDSDFFKFPVVRLTDSQLSEAALQEKIAALGRQGVRLVYWESSETLSPETCVRLGGQLVDQKVTYSYKFADDPSASFPVDERVQLYTGPRDLLKPLAFEAGTYSRFNKDPLIPTQKFHDLYGAWVEGSLNGDMADAVYVIMNHDHIGGMITATYAPSPGSIGLVAVEAGLRGQGLGAGLVQMVLGHCAEQGCDELRVVTQAANISACRLYEKCGFQLIKSRPYYHIWIQA